MNKSDNKKSRQGVLHVSDFHSKKNAFLNLKLNDKNVM